MARVSGPFTVRTLEIIGLFSEPLALTVQVHGQIDVLTGIAETFLRKKINGGLVISLRSNYHYADIPYQHEGFESLEQALGNTHPLIFRCYAKP